MPQDNVTLNVIKTWLDVAHQQVAAESYLQEINLNAPFDLIKDDLEAQLQRGNSPFNPNNPSAPADQFLRLTSQQAAIFVNRYQIIDQHANDSSGFSATLLFDTATQQYTLALRSTEYKNPSQGGDYDRDGFFGADGEINKYGFAFGQSSAMEEYYAGLKRSGRLPLNTPINVVGYSLGGNLALVFTELHPAEVNQTYVFNAAGIGQLAGVAKAQQPQKISEMLTYYLQVLFDPDAADASVGKNDAYVLARRLTARDGISFQPFASADPNNFGATRPNLYLDARHLWAVKAVAARYPLEFNTPIFKNPDSAGSDFYTQSAKVTQLFGHANNGDAERVANSGVHPEATSIFVEGQPFIEGAGGNAAGSRIMGAVHA